MSRKPWDKQPPAITTGRDVVFYFAQAEREIEWWLRYADSLTPVERRRVVSGDYSPIVRPIWQTWREGTWLKVASNLHIRIGATQTKRRGEVTSITNVRDFRSRLLRRTPGIFEPPELDEHGIPIPHDAEAIEQARLDGNYTSAMALAVPESEDSVPDAYQERFTEEAKQSFEWRQQLTQMRRERYELGQRLQRVREDAQQRGVDISSPERVIERQILKIERRVYQGKAA